MTKYYILKMINSEKYLDFDFLKNPTNIVDEECDNRPSTGHVVFIIMNAKKIHFHF